MDATDLENRFKFHPADTQGRRNAHESVREECHGLAQVLDILMPDGREKSLAITHLEEVMMWANAGIARSGR